MKRLSTILLLAVLLLSWGGAKAMPLASADSVFSSVSDATFEHLLVTQSRPVIFKVGSNVLSPADERWIADSLSRQLETIGPDGYIYCRSAASPEGPYLNNKRLADTRMAAVLKVLKKYGYDTSRIRLESVPEDYQMLVMLMREAQDADTEKVRLIVEGGETPAAVKRALQKADGGKLWKRLLRVNYPRLRSVRVVASSPAKAEEDMELHSKHVIFDRIQETLSPIFMGIEPDTVQFEGKLQDSIVINPDTLPYVEEIPDIEFKQPTVYPVLSVKTNLLYDLLYSPWTGFQPSPDIEVEFYSRNGRYSLLAEYQFPWWSNEEKREFFQIQNWQLEPRFYFKRDHWFNGHYVGIYGMYNRYDFALKGNNGSGVQGEGMGAGLSYGYVLPLGKKTSRWKLEFNIKAGYYETHYDPYDYEYSPISGGYKYFYRWKDDPSLFRKRNHRYRWLGPTGVGIKLSYDIFRGYKSLNPRYRIQ